MFPVMAYLISFHELQHYSHSCPCRPLPAPHSYPSVTHLSHSPCISSPPLLLSPLSPCTSYITSPPPLALHHCQQVHLSTRLLISRVLPSSLPCDLSPRAPFLPLPSSSFSATLTFPHFVTSLLCSFPSSRPTASFHHALPPRPPVPFVPFRTLGLSRTRRIHHTAGMSFTPSSPPVPCCFLPSFLPSHPRLPDTSITRRNKYPVTLHPADVWVPPVTQTGVSGVGAGCTCRPGVCRRVWPPRARCRSEPWP